MEDIKQQNLAIDVLDELKHQYSIFSERAADQSYAMGVNIVDIKKASTKPFRKVLSFKLIILPAVVIIYTLFYFMDIVSLLFLGATYLLVLIDAGGDYYLNRITAKLNINTDLITYRIKLLKIKRIRTVKLLTITVLSLLWAGWFGLSLLVANYENPNILTVSIAMSIAIFIGLCIEFYLYRKMQWHTDKLLNEANDLKQLYTLN